MRTMATTILKSPWNFIVYRDFSNFVPKFNLFSQRIEWWFDMRLLLLWHSSYTPFLRFKCKQNPNLFPDWIRSIWCLSLLVCNSVECYSIQPSKAFLSNHITISHCWVSKVARSMTEKSNINSFKLHIPQNFKHKKALWAIESMGFGLLSIRVGMHSKKHASYFQNSIH